MAILAGILPQVAAAAVTALAAYAIDCLRDWRARAAARQRHEIVRDAITEISDAAERVVEATEQTIVDDLRATDRWDADTAREVGQHAVETLRQSVSAEARQAAASLTPEIYSQAVEAAVHKIKVRARR